MNALVDEVPKQDDSPTACIVWDDFCDLTATSLRHRPARRGADGGVEECGGGARGACAVRGCAGAAGRGGDAGYLALVESAAVDATSPTALTLCARVCAKLALEVASGRHATTPVPLALLAQTAAVVQAVVDMGRGRG